MRDNEFWQAVQDKELTTVSGNGRTGVLNLALLFGTAAIALALVLTPVLSSRTNPRMMAHTPDEFDMISTGSVPKRGEGKRYTVRRSVLQEMPGAVCIVDADGVSSGC
ncbi:hypothetical protein [Mycoplana dimorpha]|uniref:Uncharacterized protein n=1 Tax=Mycoplana dimorpha TaxID=28320 RepID=A0A2T5BC89_MYCDI|nr:hypothetical protein [Mycoplana dimorpha]PTM96598.1 hypothetical protein C7449_103619 [Mycoplana dimorpha]